jgi:hypothetical protein
MEKTKKKIRKYPPFWEKFIPYFLAVISLAIIGLVVVALSVVFGIFPTG